MSNWRLLVKRTLRIILPMVMLMVLIIGSCQVKRVRIKANTEVIYAKAEVEKILVDNSGGQPYGGAQKVLARISCGEYEGKTCELENANSYQRGAYCVKGTEIIAILRDNNGKLTGSVYNYDRTFMIYILIGIFSISIVLVGGKKGFASLYALIFTFVCIICLYIPMLYVGINGITAALITAITILVVSIYILNGWSIKTKCAIIGTGIGVLISGIVAMIVGKVSGLDGYSMQDVESMVYIANNSKLNVSSILYAGILISSLGAVMDVSVSMVASMYEIYEKAPNLSLRQLFCSGMRVGHDMMGTMSNTLILAYAGSATGTILTIFSYEMPYLQIMGYNSVIVEIVCGLCGTLGVILTVPVQAVISCMAIKLFKNGKFAIQKQG